MKVVGKVIRDRYQDSVRLMRIGESRRSARGVEAVGVIMGTPPNLQLLKEMGLGFQGIEEATANDIVITVRGLDAVVAQTLRELESALDAPTASTASAGFATVRAALDATSSQSVLGLVATPGDYAADEACRFITAGHPVFVYSDNVSVEEERRLKVTALEAGTIVMGPDAGTGMIGGAKVGFANEVRLGPVGILAASGTGAQAISSYLHQRGSGVSHIIGLGGRDLTDDVGGLSAGAALDALIRDDATEVICLVAKEIGPVATRRLLPLVLGSDKPLVVYVQHGNTAATWAAAGAQVAGSLADAASRLQAVQATVPPGHTVVPARRPLNGRLVGLFAGGTIAADAVRVMEGVLGPLNTQVSPESGHRVIDLGDDEYTRGRPHPMIAPSIQATHIASAIADPSVDAVLFDVVLGYGAHDDPGGLIADAIAAGRSHASGDDPSVAAVVIGTDDDPQSKQRTVERLTEAGVTVFDEAGAAALWSTGIQPEKVLPTEPVPWLGTPEVVVVVGTDWFVTPLASQGTNVIHVDWRPAAGGDDSLATILGRLG